MSKSQILLKIIEDHEFRFSKKNAEELYSKIKDIPVYSNLIEISSGLYNELTQNAVNPGEWVGVYQPNPNDNKITVGIYHPEGVWSHDDKLVTITGSQIDYTKVIARGEIEDGKYYIDYNPQRGLLMYMSADDIQEIRDRHKAKKDRHQWIIDARDQLEKALKNSRTYKVVLDRDKDHPWLYVKRLDADKGRSSLGHNRVVIAMGHKNVPIIRLNTTLEDDQAYGSQLPDNIKMNLNDETMEKIIQYVTKGEFEDSKKRKEHLDWFVNTSEVDGYIK